MSDERRRILDLLTEGVITPDQAENLLRALGEQPVSGVPLPAGIPEAPLPPLPPGKPGQPARSLQIHVYKEKPNGKATNVNVTVPLGLVKFASRFLPKDAVAEMAGEGIDFNELVTQLTSEEGMETGVLVDISANEDDSDRPTRILIRAV